MDRICQRVTPPTEEARRYVLGIQIMMVIQLLVAINNIVCGVLAGQFLRQGIMGILFIFFMGCAYMKLQNGMLKWLLFFALFFIVIFLIQIFTPIQRKAKFSKFDTKTLYRFITAVISCSYYIAASIFYFYPYREFKSYQFSQNPNLRGQFHQSENDDNNRINSKIEGRQIRQTHTYDVDYGEVGNASIEKVNTKTRLHIRDQKGTFQVFQGKGISIS